MKPEKGLAIFHNAFRKGSKWYEWVTGVVTFGRYSHVEVFTLDRTKTLYVSAHANGAILKDRNIEDLDIDNEWDAVEFDIDSGLTERIYQTVEEHKGKGYDYAGAYLSVLPFIDWFCNNDKVFCSEAVHEAIYGEANSCNYSPQRLFEKIIRRNNGKILKSLK